MWTAPVAFCNRESFMPNSAVAFEREGAVVKVLVSSRDTGGDYTVCEVSVAGPFVVPEHTHTYEDQWIHVLNGCFTFEIGGKVLKGGPGDAVPVPRQTSSRVTCDGPGKLLIVARPGGLDMFFRDASACGLDGWPSVLEKHGIVIM